jgi:hypothetical protein
LETHISGTCLQYRTGRHHEAPDVAGDEVIENINWGANEESNERCGTDQEGNREGIMGCVNRCSHIDRLRDSAQQKGTSSRDTTVVRDATRDVARDFRDISRRDELRERRRGTQGSVEGCCEGYREGLRATTGRALSAGMRESTSQNDGKSIAQL